MAHYDAVGWAFRPDPVPRPSRIVKEIKQLLEVLTTDDKFIPDFPDYLGTYLLAPEEYQVDELSNDRDMFIERINLVLSELDNSEDTKFDRKNGSGGGYHLMSIP